MAIYLGQDKVQINSNNIVCKMRVSVVEPQSPIKGVMLLSSDNYILQDSSGLFITAQKEDE